mmetsp:Transcript_10303/g.13527  ORF Transcript_10303/g.13527 Transcript_10303/m.13527 type:complete len:371 (+) Transcript_10303:129-1241(+)
MTFLSFLNRIGVKPKQHGFTKHRATSLVTRFSRNRGLHLSKPSLQMIPAEVDTRVMFRDFAPTSSDMASEVLAGLSQTPKTISPKYLYDEYGSHLFDEITRVPEYYPSRTEIGILEACREEVADLIGKRIFMVEYGSGTSEKVRLLLEVLRPSGYMPIDISKEFLLNAATRLAGDYPWLNVFPTCADYSKPVELPDVDDEYAVMAFFPGSSLGNFDPESAVGFLRNVAKTVGVGSYLLIGIDRKKQRGVLEKAYNDNAGVTEAFNLNLIDRVNRDLDGTLQRTGFRHIAVYNETLGRIEMHLECVQPHEARVAGNTVRFDADERIHTESSYKYTPEEFSVLAGSAGFSVAKHFTDENDLFSVFLCRVEME